MTTYYDFLKLSPAASTAEIETAVESQYNQWRRLVTHHDPDTVQRANQALLYLQRIRTTLTDPVQRAGYDAQLGLGGEAVGGLVDPQAAGEFRPQPMFAPPPPIIPAPQAVPEVAIERVDAWLCPNCKKANQIGSTYCQGCGQVLAQVCLNCQRSYEVKAAFCPHCGETPDRVARRRELQT